MCYCVTWVEIKIGKRVDFTAYVLRMALGLFLHIVALKVFSPTCSFYLNALFRFRFSLRFGFRGNPVIFISATPTVGHKQVRLTYLTNWIERKLKEEFRVSKPLPYILFWCLGRCGWLAHLASHSPLNSRVNTLRCQINVPPPPSFIIFLFFSHPPPPLIWTPPFINFGAQGILLTIKNLKIKFHRAHSSVFCSRLFIKLVLNV